MQQSHQTGSGSARSHRQQLYFLLIMLNFAALIIYTVICAGIYGSEFFSNIEVDVLLQLLLTASGIAVCLHFLANLLRLAEPAFARYHQNFRKNKLPLLILVSLTALLGACHVQPAVWGKMKDGDTGLSTSYQAMQPEQALLVMNDEVIRHNDVPLGESLVLVNKNVKGLVERDGQVSVGCALTITDSAGKVLMNEADLFKDKHMVPAADAQYLRCTINTGKPMDWDEHYKVKVRFWDRWGKGYIDNDLTIFINGELSQE